MEKVCVILSSDIVKNRWDYYLDTLFKYGVKWVQLRFKDVDFTFIKEQITYLLSYGFEKRLDLWINDRVDIALVFRHCFKGIHVGQDDLPPSLCEVLLPGYGVGISTHTISQVCEHIGSSVSYIAVGPIFSTTTKETGYKPLGIKFIDKVRRITGKRIVAIGGINFSNLHDVFKAGADAVAMVSALWRGDFEENVSRLATIIKEVREEGYG